MPRASLSVSIRCEASYVYSVTPLAGSVTFHNRPLASYVYPIVLPMRSFTCVTRWLAS